MHCHIMGVDSAPGSLKVIEHSQKLAVTFPPNLITIPSVCRLSLFSISKVSTEQQTSAGLSPLLDNNK